MSPSESVSRPRPVVNGVIFDFDGTLVDTMSLHFRAYREVLGAIGLSLDEARFREAAAGKASETIPRLLAGRSSGAVSVDELHRRKQATLLGLLDEVEIPVLATALLLSAFKGRIPIAIASSGSREGIERMVERLDWRDVFSVIVTGEDVKRGKPAPDAFLLAAAGLGVEPAETLVFEDTDAGVQAARSAGMHVIDVRAALTSPLIPLPASGGGVRG